MQQADAVDLNTWMNSFTACSDGCYKSATIIQLYKLSSFDKFSDRTHLASNTLAAQYSSDTSET